MILQKVELPLVAVLLATNNPNLYIFEQIDSILAQLEVKVKIYWGDYGSSESIKNAIRAHLSGADFLEIPCHDEGASRNFLNLLSFARENYIAFSDQDDIWLPTKLRDQIAVLIKLEPKAALVHTNSYILRNNKIHSRSESCTHRHLNQLLFENCIQGCTMMINSKARATILRKLPNRVVYYDWWIGLILRVEGKVEYIEEPLVLYRIHANNTIGLPNKLLKFLKYLSFNDAQRSNQIEDLLTLYNNNIGISESELMQLRKITSREFSVRLIANFSDNRRRSSRWVDFVRRILWTIKRP